ncbi:MAG: tetratricopeptide repeat protein [Clostridium sp.]
MEKKLNLKNFNKEKYLTLDYILAAICIVVFVIHQYAGAMLMWGYWVYLMIAHMDFLCGFMGKLGISNNHPSKAISWYKTAAKMGNSKAKYIINYVYCEIKYGYVEDADRILTKILKKRETHKPFKGQDVIDIQMVRALLEWKKGDVNKAIEILNVLFEQEETMTLYTTLAYMKTIKGDVIESLAFSKEAYDKFEDDILVRSIYGINLYKDGQEEVAREIFEVLSEGMTNIPDTLYFYAMILIKKGDEKEAIEMLKKAIRLLRTTIITIVEPEEYTKLLDELENNNELKQKQA